MALQTQNVVKELEEIKARLISIETSLIESEPATEGDRAALKEALEEYKKRKTIPFEV